MDFKVLFSQLVVVYEKLTKQQKIIIAGAIIGIIAFLIFLIVYTAKKDEKSNYKVLFDSLNSSDAAKVIGQLEKDKIPYKVEDNNVIKVPQNIVYKEGELARTITSLSPISSATVNLALPKDTLFVTKQSTPTASIMIQLEDGRRLSSKQIRGIKNLVAAAVPKLTSANVMLVDSDGNTLGSADEMSQMGELSVVEQRYKNKEEKKKQQKIIDVVSPFVGGKDKVVAQVTIDYDFSQQNSTSEQYNPENVVRSEQTSEEKREGTKPAQVGGVPGTVSNIGPVKGLKTKQTGEKYEKNTGTTNYEVGKTVLTTKSQFARIKRITAAVIVDGKYKEQLGKDNKPTGVLKYEPLQKSDVEALTSLVSHAIGIDKTRGDQISVKNLEFKQNSKIQSKDKISQALSFSQTYLAPFSGVFKYLFVLIVLLIVYKKFITPFAEKMLEVSKEEEEIDRPNLDIDDEENEDLVGKAQEMRKKVEDQLGIGENFNEDELKYEVVLEKIKAMADESPEEVASLLQALLSEESDVSMGKK